MTHVETTSDNLLEDDPFSELVASILSSLTTDDALARVPPGGPASSTGTGLVRFSILSKVPVEDKDKLIQLAKRHDVFDRAMGSVVGMAIGDFVGAPLEFVSVTDLDIGEDTPRFNSETFAYENGDFSEFGMKFGQWTDDAAMGMCMADSMIVKNAYDGSDMRLRFWHWWFSGYCNAFRNEKQLRGSCGLGSNVSKSLHAMLPDAPPNPIYKSDGQDAGNGSLMRLAPVPVFFHTLDDKAIREFARQSSLTTHPGPIASEACAFTALFISRAINRPSGNKTTMKEFTDSFVAEYMELLRKESPMKAFETRGSGVFEMMKLLRSREDDNSPERSWNWRAASLNFERTLENRGESYNGHNVHPGYFGAYSMDGLAMALHAVYHTTSFSSAVERCVNFCGDADSTGSIAAQLAGAFYGYSTFDERFVSALEKWDDKDFATKAVLLVALARKKHSR